MALTSQQLAALKADITASGDLNSLPNTDDGAAAIAQLYSLPASPDFWVWRSSVTKDELTQSVSGDGTTFNWTGAGYITRSQGERDAFNAIFSSQGTVNPSLAAVRTAFGDIFSGGTAPAPANRTHLLTVSRRRANRLERVFATGTGSTASPAVLGYEGTVTYQEVRTARELP